MNVMPNRADYIRTALFFITIVLFTVLVGDLRFSVFFGCLMFFVVLLPHALRFQKINTSVYEYFLVAKSLNAGSFAGTLIATNLSLGNYLIIVTILGYFFGLQGLYVALLGILANFIGARLILPRIDDFIKDTANVGTIHNFIGIKHSRTDDDPVAEFLRRFCSITTIVGLLFAIVFELHIAATIFSVIFEVPAFLVFLALVLIMCFYSSIAGFAAVIFTDLIQALLTIIAVVGIILLLFYILPDPLAQYPTVFEGVSIPWTIWLSVSLLSLFWFVASMDQWQRASATPDAKVSLAGTSLGIGGMAIVGAAFVFLGIIDSAGLTPYAQTSGIELGDNLGNPLLDFFALADQLGRWTLVPLVFFGLALLFASLSTADTFLVASSHSTQFIHPSGSE